MTPERRLRATGLHPEMLDWTFESFKASQQRTAEQNRQFEAIRQVVWRFAQGKLEESWLVLAGPTGNGKSRLAAAATIHRALHPEDGPNGRWWNVPEMIDAMKAGFHHDGAEGRHGVPTYEQVMDWLYEAPFIVLDDLGAETGTVWTTGQLYKVLNRRTERRLQTIITTNVDPDHLDPRIRSRVAAAAMGFSKVIPLNFTDWRTGR